MTQIVTVPAQVLRTPAKPVGVIDSRVLKVLKDIEEVLKRAKDPQGVGLAAPQIGVLLQIFMIRPESHGQITTFINPQIIKYSQRQTNPTGKKGVYEGCLSLPHHYAPIKRSTSITIRYNKLPANSKFEIRNSKIVSSFDINASDLPEITEIYSGFPAHVIQHEMDHLNGILFIDRVLEQNAKLYKTEGKEWVEISL